MSAKSIVKRLVTLSLVGCITITSIGCTGTIRKKFVRRKKDKKPDEPILEPYDYSKEFTNKQLYANHFAFWKAAENELIAAIKKDSGRRRRETYLTHTLTELRKLNALLVEEKQKEFELYVKDMEEIADKIAKPHYVISRRNYLLKQIGEHYRAVDREFSYRAMERYVQPDIVGEGADEEQ